MTSYLDKLSAGSPTISSTRQILGVAGQATGVTPPTAIVPGRRPPPVRVHMVPALIGGGIGVFGWKKHRVLGFFGGYGVGSSLYETVTGDRTRGLCQLGTEATAIGSSLWAQKKWRGHRKLAGFGGFVVGSLIGSLVTSFIPGSDAYEVKHQG